MIKVKNSSIVIPDYDLGDCPTIERYLTVYDKLPNGFMLPKYTLYVYNEEDRELIIPRGYNISTLRKILKDDEVKYLNKPDQSRRILIKSTTTPRDDTQVEALNFLLGAGEFANTQLYESQKFLVLGTGKGKTYVSVTAVANIKERAIIIVDSLQIAEQWKEAFINFTSVKEKEIYLVSGSKSINKLMKKDKFEPDYKIYIALHQTLNSLYKNSGFFALRNLFKKIKVGVKIYDEAHASWINICMIDACTNTKRTFYLTATPGRSDPMENRLYNYIFEKVPKYGRNDVDSNSYKYSAEEVDETEAYIKTYCIKYNSNPSYATQVELNKRGMFNLNGYSDYTKTVSYDLFLSILKKLIKIALKDERKRRIAIILIKNDMISKVYDSLMEEFASDEEITIGRFCGLVPAKEKEKEKDKRIVLSTDKSLGKAINIENIGYLINTVPFASGVVAEQMIGRLRRHGKNSYLFDVTDVGFQNCVNNQKSRARTYNKKSKTTKFIDWE